MRRVIFTCILLLLLTMILASCEEHSTVPLTANEKMPEIPYNPTDPELQEYLATLYDGSLHDDWDEIVGWVNANEGGVVSGIPESWIELKNDYLFSVEIPANSIIEESVQIILPDTLPKRDWPWVPVKIMVPRLQDNPPPGTRHSPVFQLWPDMSFHAGRPATVTLCQCPWLPATTLYDVYCINYDEEDQIYYMTDYNLDVEATGCSKESKIGCPLGISFETVHFSRWALEEGSGTLFKEQMLK
ncbi:MAG: hypothetical protein ABIF77_05565 [bacterium]